MKNRVAIVVPLLAVLLGPLGPFVSAGAGETSGETIMVRLEGWRTAFTEKTGTYGPTSQSASATLAVADGEPGFLYVALDRFAPGGASAGAGGAAEGAIGTDPATMRRELLEKHPFVWWVEVTPRKGAPGKIELQVEWERLESEGQGEPVRTAGDARRVVIAEGQEHVLDFERLPPDTGNDRAKDLILKLTAEIKEDPELAHELLRYKLWHRHRHRGKDLNTRKIMFLGKQGEEVDYRFAPLRFDPESLVEGDPSAVDFIVEILGSVRGRVRPDGTIEVRLVATRWTDAVLDGKPRSGGTSEGGTKIFTVSSGESVVLELPAHGGGSTSIDRTVDVRSAPGEPRRRVADDRIKIDHEEAYREREDAIILTVTRER